MQSLPTRRFATLLKREWMQHQTGWLVVMGLPLLLLLLAGVFGEIHFDADTDMPPGGPTALMVALGTLAAAALLPMLLTWGASLLMAPGLARRDVQDRSIEFWLSLPVSHTQSLGATLLMHLLLVPWLALGVGLAGGMLGSLVIVTRLYGIGDWFALPWGAILAAGAVVGARLMLGLLLATLWLSPLILLTMAASAWLKRWGVPLVIGLVVVGGTVLDRAYDNPVVWRVLDTLTRNATQAFIVADRGNAERSLLIHRPEQFPDLLAALPGWALRDAGHALAGLASPAFALALLGAAAGFALLWLRRERGA